MTDDAAIIANLNNDYETWCRGERIAWMEEHPNRYAEPNPNNVREVDPAGQRELQWQRHIEKVGTAWWRDRGFKLHWPEGHGPCKVEPYPFCCDAMARAASLTCNQHDAEDCPDVLIKITHNGKYGIRIHDGGSSFIVISFCPWCATKLHEDAAGEDAILPGDRALDVDQGIT